MEGVAICTLNAADVVRHPLVQRLVQAYARRMPPPVPAADREIRTVRRSRHRRHWQDEPVSDHW